MIPAKKESVEKNSTQHDPVKDAKLEAEEGISKDPDFADDPSSDDLDEGELANLDNSSDNDI